MSLRVLGKASITNEIHQRIENTLSKNTSQVYCSLCMKEVKGKPFYIDKYPHHKKCKNKVIKYLKKRGIELEYMDK